MATITIRNLDDALKSSLRLSAARHGRSMEEEVRQILRLVLNRPLPAGEGLGSRLARRFAAGGGVDLPIVERSPVRQPPDFSEDVVP
ncbi:MAG: FitA-like ribbon-helix-helix domain-containing protein [Desulfurivibrionaceae bacterium]